MNAGKVQLNVGQIQLNVGQVQLHAEQVKLSAEQSPQNSEAAPQKSDQGPKKSEQSPKKNNSQYFGFLERICVFLSTLAVSVGAYLWSTLDALPVGLGKWLVAAAFLLVLLVAVLMLIHKMSKMSQG